MLRLLATVLLAALLTAGCAARPVNPSFAVTADEARQAMRDMAARPRQLDRPVVVIGGYLDPNVSPTYLKAQVRKLTGDGRVIGVMVGFSSSFEECRQKVIEAVDAAWPSADPDWTTEVDVIGASLGGLVGRYAAAPCRDAAHPRRLKIARLFTIASPHSGAVLAKTATLSDFQSDMRPESSFTRYLAEQDGDARYELFPYARLNDKLVGERYTAPPGQTPLWLPTPPFESGHGGAWHDPRILADIGRRLRGETPFSTKPATPLPE
jgi:pimeloyl-ACP methyl ester carboxylesterase